MNPIINLQIKKFQKDIKKIEKEFLITNCFCKNCNKTVSEYDDYCSNCGVSLNIKNTNKEIPKYKNKYKVGDKYYVLSLSKGIGGFEFNYCKFEISKVNVKTIRITYYDQLCNMEQFEDKLKEGTYVKEKNIDKAIEGMRVSLNSWHESGVKQLEGYTEKYYNYEFIKDQVERLKLLKDCFNDFSEDKLKEVMKNINSRANKVAVSKLKNG